MNKFRTIILAAGKGTRMKSDLPKVLHEIAGKSLVKYVVEASRRAGSEDIYAVVGYQAEKVMENLKNDNIVFVEQKEQLGTGHAVQQAEPFLKDFEGDVLVLCGDVPNIKAGTLQKVYEEHKKNEYAVTILSAELDDPAGYGRIVRKEDGTVTGIVEQKDASDAEKSVKEINSGTYFFDCPSLFRALGNVENKNAQKEFYLTDTVRILAGEGKKVGAVCVADSQEIMGINTVEQLNQMRETVFPV